MTTLKIPGNLGWGGAHLNRGLRKILAQLQDHASAVRQSAALGANNNTDIPVAGIRTGDKLVGVVLLEYSSGSGWAVYDLLSEAVISSDGNIRLPQTITTGDALLVTWLARS